MDITTLQDIGLTQAEIKVYLATLELGTSTAGPILDKTGLQNSVVHMTLHKLIEKGLVSFVKEGKRNHYQAANPQHLVDMIEHKKERVEQLLPELLLMQRQASAKPEVKAFRGINGIKELLLELLEAGGKEHLTIGSSEKSLMMTTPWWESYHRKRMRKGIKAKIVFNESLRSWKAEGRYGMVKLRYTDEGFEPLTETIIRNDKVGIIIWSDKPLGMIIHQQEAADSYKAYFEKVWDSASS